MINNETIIYELCNKYQWFTCGGVRQYEKAVRNPEKAHAAERCGESDLCNRCRA